MQTTNKQVPQNREQQLEMILEAFKDPAVMRAITTLVLANLDAQQLRTSLGIADLASRLSTVEGSLSSLTDGGS